MEKAPDGHDCCWRFAELRRDAHGGTWVRDECVHGWSGGWFRRDGEPGVPPWEV